MTEYYSLRGGKGYDRSLYVIITYTYDYSAVLSPTVVIHYHVNRSETNLAHPVQIIGAITQLLLCRNVVYAGEYVRDPQLRRQTVPAVDIPCF